MFRLRSVNKCRRKSALRLAFYFSWCCFFAIAYRFLSRSAGTSQKNTALKKRLVFLIEFLLPAFRQERVQKRVCSEATKKRLPKAESMKKKLLKAEAVKNVLP